MDKNLKILWTGDFFSTLGASVYILAVTLLAHQLSGSMVEASIVLFSGTIPYFFFGVIGGVAADRFNKKKLMIFCELLRALLVLTIPVMFYFTVLNIGTLIAVSVLLTILRAFYHPASQAVIPELVKTEEDLNKVNSYFHITKNLAAMLGPSLGGVFLLLNLNVPSLLLINFMAYLLSALFVYKVSFPPLHKQEEIEERMLISAWYGLKYMLYENKFIAIMMFAFVCQLLIGVGVIQLAIPNLLTTLNLSAENFLGFVLSTITLSAVAFSFIMARMKIIHPVPFLFFGYSLRTVALVILAFANSFPTVIIAASVLGISFTIGGITMTTYLQTSSAKQMLGRVMAFRSTLGNVTDGFAFLIVGFLLTIFNLQLAFIVMGVYTLSTVILAIILWGIAQKNFSQNYSNYYLKRKEV